MPYLKPESSIDTFDVSYSATAATRMSSASARVSVASSCVWEAHGSNPCQIEG